MHPFFYYRGNIMNNRELIIETAIKEIGYKEEPNGDTKYCREYYNAPSNVEWCCIFIWWLFKKCKLSHLFFDGGKVASCGAVHKWGSTHGYITTEPVKGDLVIWSFRKLKNGARETSHIGIIEKVTDKEITAIEGNTSIGAESNGGEVMRRTRSRNLVYSFVHIPYEPVSIEYDEYIVKKGDTLSKICLSHYGNAKLYTKVAEYNNINPNIIYTGQKIKLPKGV